MTENALTRRAALMRGGGLVAAALAATQLAELGPLAQLASADSSLFGPLSHIGFVLAPDFDQTQAVLGAGLGIQWDPIVSTQVPVLIEPGYGKTGTYDTRFVFTSPDPGSPRIELLDSIQHTFYQAKQSGPIVELAYQVTQDNLATACNTLVDAGMPFVGTVNVPGASRENPQLTAWLQAAPGIFIELVTFSPFGD